MNKMRFLTFLCVLCFAVTTKAQQQVSKNEARNAAINTLFYKEDVLKRSSNTEIDTVHSFLNSRSNVLMYEVVFKNKTAVLLSGSKACLPVLGYYIKSEHDNGAIFDTTNPNVSCCLQEFIYDYIQELEWCFTHDSIVLHHEEQWNDLQISNKQKSNSRTNIMVDSLLTTKWNQDWSNDWWICDAYNNFVTKTSNTCDCDSERCLAGCVAVAMAQIMKYWNYPVYIIGKVKQFDWCNMPNYLYYQLPPLYNLNPNYTKERNAINHLLEDCGEKANMTYCNNDCGSSSNINKARNALVNDFGYSSDADVQTRFWWSDNVWKGKIKANLNQGYPIYYRGRGDDGGHAFVCEGYDSDDYFRFNWGWGGSNDGFFTIDILNTTEGSFNKYQKAIFNIYPTGYPNYQEYCNFTLPLALHYAYWNGIVGFPTSIVHAIVPKTATTLISVPEGNGVPTGWHTIASGEVAIYTAHEEVRLLPGFHAEAGSTFIARIDPCPSCGNISRSTILFTQGGDVNDTYTFDNFNDTAVQKSVKNNLQKKDESKDNEITILPNPNTGTFSIKINFDPQEVISIRVLNPLGLLVYEQVGLPSNTVQLPSSVKGLFYVEIQTTTQRFIRKMVVH